MNITSIFPAPFPKPDIDALSRQSIAEARDKEVRMRTLYADPYRDGKTRWPLADLALDYTRTYKTEGTKRKNGFEETALHELNIGLFFKALLDAGLLPKKVTYEVIAGKKHAIPASQQSIEHLFSVINFHDIDEDFPDSSPEEMSDVLMNWIAHDQRFSLLEKDALFDQIENYPALMRAITFGRKVRVDGIAKRELTHDGDPQNYLDAMEENWTTILAKAGDRLRGIVDRYGPVPHIFTWQRQHDYLDETRDLFYFRRTVENMQVRYPQLKDAFAVINARMQVAFRATQMIVNFHPDNISSNRKTGNPLTARLDIHEFLPVALKIKDYLDDDTDDLKALLVNLEYVADRRPTLRGITLQLRQQLSKFMPELDNIKPPFGSYAETPREIYAPIRS